MLSAMALLVVAAAGAIDDNFERLRNMPDSERDRLLKNLKKFDLTLSPEQQSAVRDLDRQLAELPAGERGLYQCVLRRYHDWLNGLPEQRQDELAAKPPGERMALIRKWIVESPVPVGDTATLLRAMEPGEYNPFEVASAYRIWDALSEKEREDLQKETSERSRREALFRLGNRSKHGIPRETIRDEFDEEKWVGRLTPVWGNLHAIAQLEEIPKSKANEAAKKKVAQIRPAFVRRQAINLFVSGTPVRSVDPERLARFMESLPPWIPASFDSLAPDEARRRLAFAYRQVFPYPEEIGASRKPAGAPARGHPTTAPKAGGPPAGTRKAAGGGGNNAPF